MSDPRLARCHRPFAIAWLIVLGYVALTAILVQAAGLTVTGYTRLLASAAVIGGVAALYGASGRSRTLSQTAHWALLWIIFATASGVLTYATAAMSGPLDDAALAGIDSALGLPWVRWHGFVTVTPGLRFALALIYVTLLPQIIFSLLYFGLTGRNGRNAEFFFIAAGALFATIMTSWCVPALGAAAFHGFPEDVARLYLGDLEALRAHALRRVELTELKGIIQFPSFHTTLALIFPYVHRDSGRLFRPLLALNLILLISIPVGGGHHFADMIAGAVIGLLAIAIARHLGSRQPGIAGPGKERLATAEDLGSS